MAFLFSILLLHIFNAKEVSAATFTFVNKCSHTIWPAILGSPTVGTTGFDLPQGGSRAFQAPTGWSGRFWARTGCSFDGSGHGSCSTGDCDSGQIECNGAGATAATLVEFTLGSGSMDFYLPVTVDASGGSGQCASTGCVEDLNKRCPAKLKVRGGGACRSACVAFNTPEFCCKGEHGPPSTCKPSEYSQVFKNACPKAYSYAYDDATSTFTCTAADNYVITFCPTHPSQKPSKPDGGTGSVQEAMLADGSMLANLATGDSTRTRPFGTTGLCLIWMNAVVHLGLRVVPLQMQLMAL